MTRDNGDTETYQMNVLVKENDNTDKMQMAKYFENRTEYLVRVSEEVKTTNSTANNAWISDDK